MKPPISNLGGLRIGVRYPVRIMGVINISPESFYKGSVPKNDRALSKKAEELEKEGADLIDVGAMSTAPYLKTEISEIEEARRLSHAVRVIRRSCSLPISIDTSRFAPAEAGFAAGASILNDVTGLLRDPALGKLARYAKGAILMAHPLGAKRLTSPVKDTLSLLKAVLSRARKNGIPAHKIVLDPGIGFFRGARLPWWKWDLLVLGNLEKIAALPSPLLIGVSRKSFLGKIMGGAPPEKRLEVSVAAAVVAVSKGASLIRTHDVAATREAVHIAETIRQYAAF